MLAPAVNMPEHDLQPWERRAQPARGPYAPRRHEVSGSWLSNPATLRRSPHRTVCPRPPPEGTPILPPTPPYRTDAALTPDPAPNSIGRAHRGNHAAQSIPPSCSPRSSAWRRAGSLALVGTVVWAAAAWGRTLNCELLRVGYELDAEEMRDTLGRSCVVAEPGGRSQLRLPPIEASEARQDEPRSLLLSNNPEVLDGDSMPRRSGVLVSARLDSGGFRVLASHTNLNPLGYDLFLRVRSASDEAATVEVHKHCAATASLIPGTQRLDCGVGASLLTAYSDSAGRAQDLLSTQTFAQTLRPNEARNLLLVRDFRGLACSLTEATTSAPIQASVVAVPHGSEPGDDLKPLPRRGPQARGLYTSPDLGVQAKIGFTDGQPRRYVFGQAERTLAKGVLDSGNWMRGADTTLPDRVEVGVNRGDFGGITHFHAEVEEATDGRFKGVLLVLAAGGPKAAVLAPGMPHSQVLERWHGQVVARLRPREVWDYTYTLPPNSWAPVYLVSIPLRGAP
jgi:hypothetical protein